MLWHFGHLYWKVGLFILLASMLGFTIALAASGDLDSTFDGDGLVTNHTVPSNPGRDDYAYDIAIYQNEKIVAVGSSYVSSTGNSDFALLRYNTDGSLDNTFSGDGMRTTNFGGFDVASGVAVQTNGKIVAAGRRCTSSIGPCDVALARYNPGGALDTNFSGDGKLTTDFGGGNNGSYAIAIQPDGKIVVAGYMHNGANDDFAVYRYLSNGSLDTAFSQDGMVKINFGSGRQDVASDLVIQSNGKIVVVGFSGNSNHVNNDFAVARLKANGALDTTFSGDGKQLTDFGAEEFGNGVALQADGKIVVVGRKNTDGFSSFAIARYDVSGSLDTTFNGTGMKVFNILPTADATAFDVSVQADGKIVVAGHTEIGGDNDHAMSLVRLDSVGGFDMNFSDDGIVTVEFGGDDYLSALILQPLDGKYVIGGFSTFSAPSDFALARVLP